MRRMTRIPIRLSKIVAPTAALLLGLGVAYAEDNTRGVRILDGPEIAPQTTPRPVPVPLAPGPRMMPPAPAPEPPATSSAPAPSAVAAPTPAPTPAPVSPFAPPQIATPE